MWLNFPPWFQGSKESFAPPLNSLVSSVTLRVMPAPQISIEEIVWPSRSAAEVVRCFGPESPAMIWETGERELGSDGSVQHLPARYSLVIVRPRAVMKLQRGQNEYLRPSETAPSLRCSPQRDDPFKFISRELRARGLVYEGLESRPQLPYPTGGVFGFVAYDVARYFEQTPAMEGHPTEPDIFLLSSETVIIVDRILGTLKVVGTPADDSRRSMERSQRAVAEVAKTLSSAAAQAAPLPEFSTPNQVNFLSSLYSKTEFMEKVARAKEYIAAGDIFQVVLGNTFTLPPVEDPLTLFELLRVINPSPYHFFVRFDQQSLVGASPEVMVRGRKSGIGGTTEINMRLVAGTYPRGSDPDADGKQAAALSADEKERAEHLMLVDHARNDIGRVARTGSVQVKDIFSVESYANIHHLVSQVSGTLRPEENVLTALRACFPIATLTGTPKIRAMEIIAELEGPSRGIFGGALVALGDCGGIDSAVAIRSILCGAKESVVRAGAGIVFDSDEAREFAECQLKAKTLAEAVAICQELRR